MSNHDHDDHDHIHAHDTHKHDHEAEEVCASCSGLTDHAHGESCGCGHDQGEDHGHDHEHGDINWRMTTISGVIITAGILMEFYGVGGISPRLLLLSAILIEGHKPARSGIKLLGRGVVGIDLLMTIAATGAVIIGEYAEGAMVLFLKDISMKLEIMAPHTSIGEITNYLQARRAVINSVDTLIDIKRLLCEVPLAEMFGFSKALPKLSGGRASFSMEPCGYQEISPEALNRINGNS